MNRILVFGASSSKQSINRQFALYTANQFNNATIVDIDLNDFEMPIYSIDKERDNGIHPLAIQFMDLIESSDAIIISFAEHNGAYSSAFKNIYDWVSRIEGKVWREKAMFLLGTSPGGRGASTVLDIAVSRFPFNGGNVVTHFSLPFFSKNFNLVDGILDETLRQDYQKQCVKFETYLA